MLLSFSFHSCWSSTSNSQSWKFPSSPSSCKCSTHRWIHIEMLSLSIAHPCVYVCHRFARLVASITFTFVSFLHFLVQTYGYLNQYPLNNYWCSINQYPCSTNPDCECLWLTEIETQVCSAKPNCGCTSPCDANYRCSAPNTTCVFDKRCDGTPRCYATTLFDNVACPEYDMGDWLSKLKLTDWTHTWSLSSDEVSFFLRCLAVMSHQ
jgi:hypothetical protein